MGSASTFSAQDLKEAIYTRGLTGLPQAFSAEFTDKLRSEIEALFAEATSTPAPNGAIGRGPARYYVEIHPERLSGFKEIISHPWVQAVAESVLGPDYRIVECGFDIPFPGAKFQPWHRDFPSPPETYRDKQITSLAFNLTTIDTTLEMGPFEFCPGTHWEDGLDFNHQQFPGKEHSSRYSSLAEKKLAKKGDIAARTALAIHRGTPNESKLTRPVLIIGYVSPGADESRNDMQMSKAYYDKLPADIKKHIGGRIVDKLEPLMQKHTIEGLVMAAEEY